MNSKYVFSCLYAIFLLVAAVLDFHSQLCAKEFETTLSVLIETLGSEKLQFYKIYMKSSVLVDSL